MKTRKDLHRPSQIKTNDYQFLGCIYIGPDEFAQIAFSDERRVIPRSMIGMADRGTKIEMMVNVTASVDDPFFGFGKRPSKAKIIGE